MTARVRPGLLASWLRTGTRSEGALREAATATRGAAVAGEAFPVAAEAAPSRFCLGAVGGKRAGSQADGRGLELGLAPAGGYWATPQHPGWEIKNPLGLPGTPRARGSLHLGNPTCRPAA